MKRLAVLFFVAAIGVAGARTSAALMMFDSPRPLASNAATDGSPPGYGEDGNPSIAGDGSGTWVALWYSVDPTIGVVVDSGVGDVVLSRSVDDGRTWSAAAVLNLDAATEMAVEPSIATNNAGTWIAVWTTFGAARLSRSTDDGATWSNPVEIAGLSSSTVGNVSITGDAAGRWVILWWFYDTSASTHEVGSAHSEDDGLSWSAPSRVPDDATAVTESAFNTRIVTDGAGTWMSIWEDGQISLAVSTDTGATWGPRIEVGPYLFGDAPAPDLATDGAGTWVAVWNSALPLVGADSTYNDRDIVAEVSTDNGATWGAPTPVGGLSAVGDKGDRGDARVRYQDGVWQIVWTQLYDSLGSTVGQEGDLIGVRSFDGAITWTDPAAINVNASRDNTKPSDISFPWPNLDDQAALATAANGTSLLVWTSTNSLGGTIGNDFDILYARSHDDCSLTPMAGCRVPTAAGASSLIIKNPVGGRDILQWKWHSGQETLPAALGNPTASSNYVLCLYDKAGATLRSVLETDAATGTQCRSGNCWTAAGTGFRYNDPDRRNGPMRSVALTPGGDGDASIDVKAGGAALAPPVMPLAMAPSVRIQLVNTENNECWEATFSTAQSNNSTLFKARSD